MTGAVGTDVGVDVGAGFDGSASLEAAPINTWFGESIRWYQQHLNAKQFYTQLELRPDTDVSNAGYPAASGMFEGVLPVYEPPITVADHPRMTRHAGRHHFKHAHHYLASR